MARFLESKKEIDKSAKKQRKKRQGKTTSKSTNKSNGSQYSTSQDKKLNTIRSNTASSAPKANPKTVSRTNNATRKYSTGTSSRQYTVSNNNNRKATEDYLAKRSKPHYQRSAREDKINDTLSKAKPQETPKSLDEKSKDKLKGSNVIKGVKALENRNTSDMGGAQYRVDLGSRSEFGDRIGNLTKGSVKQVVGGHFTSISHQNDRTGYDLEMERITDLYKKGRLNKADYEAEIKSLRERENQGKEQSEVYESKARAIQAEGDKQVQEGMKGLSGISKIGAEAYNSLIGMGMDMALGPASLVGMASRTHGNSINSVNDLVKKGIISAEEAERYAAMQSGKEVLTELFFKGTGAAAGYAGAGKATEKLSLMVKRGIDKATQRINNNVLKNVVSTGLKLGQGAAEEATEEAIAGVLDAPITNIAYANRLDKEYRGGLKENGTNINSQRDQMMKYGYTRDEATNIFVNEIGGDGFLEELAQQYIDDGMSEKKALEQANNMQEYMIASLNGDEKTMKSLEDKMAEGIKAKFSLSDTLEAMAAAGLMTTVTGGVGAVDTAIKGEQIKNAFAQVNGEDNAAKSITRIAKGLSDKEMAARASAMYDYASQGKELSYEQYVELGNAIAKQRYENAQKAKSAHSVGMETAKKESFFAVPGVGVSSNGNYVFGESYQLPDGRGGYVTIVNSDSVTNKDAEQSRVELYKIADRIENEMGTSIEDKDNFIEELVAAEYGYANEAVVEYLTDAFPENRAIYEMFTGETLPTDNAKMRDAVYQRSTLNFVKTAERETIDTIDRNKGFLDVQFANTIGSEGQQTFQALSDNIGVEDTEKYTHYANVMGKVYEAGRNELPLETVLKFADANQIAEEDVKLMYEAGKADGINPNQPTVKFDISKGTAIRNSHRDTLLAFSRIFGVNIVVTDKLTVEKANKIKNKQSIEESDNVGNQVNGMFYDNTIYINLNDDIRKPIGYTIMHELTHGIKQMFPEDYNTFAELFKERWIAKTDEESFNKAIQGKIDAYAKAGAAFDKETEKEDALEEIICDQMAEVLYDEQFMQNVAENHPSLAQSLLYAIQDVIRKIRQLFANYGGFRSEFNEATLSQLDMLKDAEALLMKAIQAAQDGRTQEILNEGKKLSVIERKNDPLKLTKTELKNNLTKVRQHQLNRNSFLPLRATTPLIIIEAAKAKGIELENLPMIMRVKHLMQLMDDEGKRGEKHRGHGFTEDDIIALSEKLSKPEKIFFQKRTYKDSGDVVERITALLRIKSKGGTHLASIELDASTKDPKYMNGYEGGYYNTIVTIFKKDEDYYKKETENKEYIQEIEELYDNKKGLSQSASGRTWPSDLNDNPFYEDSLSPNEEEVKGNNTFADIEDFFLNSAPEGKLSIGSNIQDEQYLEAVNNGDMRKAQQMVDEAAQKSGYKELRYHETKPENDIHVFTTDNAVNASGDPSTPYGIFTKRTDAPIGLGGKQMKLWVKAENTFKVKDRESISEALPEEYSNFISEIEGLVGKYSDRLDNLEDEFFIALDEWFDTQEDGDSLRDAWDVTKSLSEQDFADRIPDEIIGAEENYNRLMEEWKREEENLIADSKEWMTSWLRNNGYDSMELAIDAGSGGRSTDALIVLDANQVKSADPVTYDDNGDVIPLSKRFDSTSSDIRFSIDSNGNELSQAQAEYFKDSKVRDEEGNLMVMYHGTPSGNFTVFKDGTYFTPNKQYAERYQNPSASSISTGKVADKPKMYEVYLDIKKPFDINEPEARRIYIEEYIKGGNAIGINPYESDAYYNNINSIDWTEGEDLRDFLIEEGYDYDGLVLDEGADGGYGDAVEYRGNSYVIFSPEQVKNIDNLNPTENPDIRFSMDAPYEETKDLIAVHNLNEDNIRGLQSLGGMPMPSIAIIKAAQGHNMYGDYSFVFDKATIDPKKNRANKVYGGDAWTPTFPRIDYEVVRDSAFDDFQKKISALRDGAPESVRRVLNRLAQPDTLADKLGGNNGVDGLKESLLDDEDMKNAFLNTKGEYVDTIYTKTEKTMPDGEFNYLNAIIDALGTDVISEFSVAGLPTVDAKKKHRQEYAEKYSNEIREAIAAGLNFDGTFTKEKALEVVDSMNDKERLLEIRHAFALFTNGRTQVEEKADYQATWDEIDKRVDNIEYRKWLDDLFDGLNIESGLYNGKDPFTPSGNRRSFKQTHMPATLENIVKAMKLKENGETVLGDNFKAVAQKEFSSIKDIKSDSNRLQNIDEAEYEKLNDELAKRESDIISSFFERADISSYDNEFIVRDSIRSSVTDSIRSSKNEADVLKKLKRYYYTETATEEDAAAIWKLAQDTANLPTGYFEAKPERAVTFDEVKTVIAPDNAPADVIQFFDAAGVDVVQYENGNDADRTEKLNSLENMKFSIDSQLYTKKEYNNFGWARANNYISETENAIWKSMLKDKKNMNKAADGSYIIPVGDKPGIANVLIYTKGTYENPKITKIVRINKDIYADYDVETELDEIRRYVYEEESKSNSYACEIINEILGEELFTTITKDDCIPYEEYSKGTGGSRSRKNNIFDEDDERRGGTKEPVAPLSEVIPSKDDVMKFSFMNPLDTSWFDGDLGEEAVNPRGDKNKSISEITAEFTNIVRDNAKLTGGKVLDRKSIKKQIGELVKMTTKDTTYTATEKREIAGFLMDTAEQIWSIVGEKRPIKLKQEEIDRIINLLYEASDYVISNAQYLNDSMLNEIIEFKKFFRGRKVGVSAGARAELADDWDTIRKRNIGRVRFVSAEKYGVTNIADALYEAFQEAPETSLLYGREAMEAMEIGDEATLVRILDDVLSNLSVVDDAIKSEYAEDFRVALSQDFARIVLNEGEAWNSKMDRFKDRYEQRIKDLRARQKEAVRDMRNNYEKLLTEQNATFKKKLAETKAKSEAKIQAEKAKNKAKEQKRKASEQHKQIWGRISKDYKWLADRLVNGKKDDFKHIPSDFVESVANLLEIFDFQTERSLQLEEKRGYASEPTKAMRELRDKISKYSSPDGGSIFVKNDALDVLVDECIEFLDGRALRELEDYELQKVSEMLRAVRHMVKTQNELFVANRKATVAEAGESIISESAEKVEKYGRRYDRTGISGKLSHLLNETMMTPGNFFDSLGGTMRQMYKNLRKGQDDYIRKIDYLRNFHTELLKPYYKKAKPGSVVEDWQTKANEFTLSDGSQLKMTVAQVMSLYCLSKREQALGHILGSGIVLSDVSMDRGIAKVIGGKIQNTASGYRMTYNDMMNVISSLTDEQRKIADSIQNLMNTTLKDWGNETSLRLFDMEFFTEENYFPISVEQSELATEVGKGTEIKGNRITSFGMTKPLTKHANNRIIIGDIFSISADHCNKMALYSAYAPSLIDFNRVYNYKQRNEDGTIGATVKGILKDAYSNKALKFIDNILDDINGQAQPRTDGLTAMTNAALANYKKAAIGLNVRVLVQQPTAIMRSLYMINPRYFTPDCFIGLKKAREEMHTHCPIAAWKAWGNYQNDYTKSLEDVMLNKDWSKLDVVTMSMYGWADDMTWAVIWNAVKNEVKHKNPNVEVGSEEYWNLCNERASEIYDETQVVDSVFHRSDAMRNPDKLSKVVTSFMAEPTRTYNMIRSSVVKAYRSHKDGDNKAAAAELNKMLVVVVLNAAAVSAAAAVVDAFRGKGDDDDEETWLETFYRNFGENFKDNVNMLHNIVYVKDVVSLFENAIEGKYFSPSNMVFDGWTKLAKGVGDYEKVLSGDKSFIEWISGDFGAGIGYVTGIPTATFIKDTKALWSRLSLPTFASDGEEDTPSLWDYENNPLEVTDGTWADNVLNFFGINLTPEERAERDFKRTLKEVESKTKDLSGAEKKEAVNKIVMDGYTQYVEDGDYAKLKQMRRIIKEAGGDVEAFDEKVTKRTASEYKKTIGVEGTGQKQAEMRQFLLENGWTEAKISGEIIYKSNTAKDFKAACREMDLEKATDVLTKLYIAGLTEEDAYKLWQNRNRGSFDTYSTGNLIAPTSGTITSKYGYRTAPTAGASSYHEGIDIGAPRGTVVSAADGGTVVYVGYNGGYGNQIVIQHDDGTQTYYSHLDHISVRKGQSVSQKQYIGNVGSTGTSTGAHLDFRVRVNGSFVDPMKYINA